MREMQVAAGINGTLLMEGLHVHRRTARPCRVPVRSSNIRAIATPSPKVTRRTTYGSFEHGGIALMDVRLLLRERADDRRREPEVVQAMGRPAG
jgi:hypothetical protein